MEDFTRRRDNVFTNKICHYVHIATSREAHMKMPRCHSEGISFLTVRRIPPSVSLLLQGTTRLFGAVVPTRCSDGANFRLGVCAGVLSRCV